MKINWKNPWTIAGAGVLGYFVYKKIRGENSVFDSVGSVAGTAEDGIEAVVSGKIFSAIGDTIGAITGAAKKTGDQKLAENIQIENIKTAIISGTNPDTGEALNAEQIENARKTLQVVYGVTI